MNRRPLRRAAITAAVCVAVGAIAGIAGSAGAPSKKSSKSSSGTTNSRRAQRPPRPFHGGPPVHVEAVVLNRAGDKFITVTEDSGTVQSVSGDDLVVNEAIGSVTYKTVTLTIPSNAKVVRNFANAKLADLKQGDFVHVEQSSDGTVVFAADKSHRPPRFGHRGRGGDGPRHGGPGWGPPPGPPPGTAGQPAPPQGSLQ